MASDECETLGLNVKSLSEETLDKFRDLVSENEIPSYASYHNPVDLTGVVTSRMYELSTKILLEDQEINGIIILGLHHTPHLTEDFTDRIAQISKEYRKPIVACDIGETEMANYIRSRFNKLGIPAYSSPEDTAYAMSGLVEYGIYLTHTTKD